MNIKIIGTFVGAIIIFGTLTGAISVDIVSNNEDQMHLENETDFFGESAILNNGGQVVKVRIKFFVHPNFNKKLDEMVKKLNEVFVDENSNNNVVFEYGGSSTTLGADNFTNINTYNGRTELLKKLKNESKYRNCSKGINVVIGPFDGLGLTRFDYETGTATRPDGGVIINDTCDQDDMNETLIHELLHALGLSHELVKWFNATSGKNESKSKETTIKNFSGSGNDVKIPANRLGGSVPPHGFRYFDRDGDCDCEDNADEQPRDAGGPIWDINGNCTFGDADDKDNALWGRDDNTGVTISEAQRKKMFDTANNTPGYKITTAGQNTQVPQKEKSNSDASSDAQGDAEQKHLDILGSLGIIYFEHGYLLFALQILEEIPDGAIAYYSFYIDKDDDINTGCSGGYDYVIDLVFSPEDVYAALWEWNIDYEDWFFVEYLEWDFSPGAEDYFDENDGGEVIGSDENLRIYIPLGSLNIEYEGYMRITPVATDGWKSRETDQCPDIYLSKEQEILPVLNLNPYDGEPGDSIVVNGYDFSSNSVVTIKFDALTVATIPTDGNGDFTTAFNVPGVNAGYHTVGANDENGKVDVRLFMVKNVAPNKPVIDGKTRGSAGTSYPYTFTSTDPNGDQVSYHISWGDGDITDWTALQASGPPGFTEAHAWDIQDEYTITAKAKDEFGLIGPEATLTVTMPRNRAITSPFLSFLQQHPNLFPILQLLLQRLGLQ